MTDLYLYFIIGLLPLSALMLVLQVNPYNALIIRGVLGAVAAMVDAVLGAADVALTEALMGTLLAVTLYAIAVRSSLVMRLGIVQKDEIEADEDPNFQELIDKLRTIVSKRYMRLELVPYTNTTALDRALIEKEIHGTCTKLEQWDETIDRDENQSYHGKIRIQRLYDIIQTELSSPSTIFSYISVSDSGAGNK